LDASPYPERAFTLLSLIFAVVGVAISGWSVFNYTMPPSFLLVKDLVIYGSLLILCLYFFLRYRRAVSEVERQRKSHKVQLADIQTLVRQQIETYQWLMSHTRASFYGGVDASIYQHRFTYIKPGLAKLLDDSLDRVLTAIRKILESHLRSKNPAPRAEISLSVKALVTGAMAEKLCSLEDVQSASLVGDKQYVITLDRDHDTKMTRQEREYRKAFYDVEANSDFSRIISGELEDFQSDNLKELEVKREYRNTSPDWQRNYNATQVVPIWHRHGSESNIFGFLTVDSLNPNNEQLFDRKETLSIMMFGADLLALLFLTLDVYDRLPESNGPKQITEARGARKIPDHR
jgi:hypothetical protein